MTEIYMLQIGLMRGGYFLAEESPERLISQFNAESLEDVFLKLSVIQNMGKRRRSSILQTVTETIHVSLKNWGTNIKSSFFYGPPGIIEFLIPEIYCFRDISICKKINIIFCWQVPELPGGAVNEAAVLDDEPHGEISGEFGDNVSMTSRTSSKYKQLCDLFTSLIILSLSVKRRRFI